MRTPDDLHQALCRYNAAATAYNRRRSSETMQELDAAGDVMNAAILAYGAHVTYVGDYKGAKLAMLQSFSHDAAPIAAPA
jgi:hypothetical protein